jgi:hypothetical protein
MKRILLVLIIISSTSHAQEERLSISSHFGYSISSKLFASWADLRATFNAGVEIRKQIGKKGIYLQTGIRWNEFGWRQRYSTFDWNGESWELNDLDIKSTYFYLTLPLIATYKFKKLVPGLTLSAGPQLSVYMFRKGKINEDLEPTPANWETSIFNFNAHFAVGYEHNLGEKWILGGELYSNAIFPIGVTPLKRIIWE